MRSDNLIGAGDLRLTKMAILCPMALFERETPTDLARLLAFVHSILDEQ